MKSKVRLPGKRVTYLLTERTTIMRITWDVSLQTDVAEVDDQHRELFRQVDQLHEAILQGRGRDEIARIIDFLQKYVVDHFAAEERIMDELACPAAAANKRAHAEFLTTFTAFRRQFDEQGAKTTLVLEMYEKLTRWLVAHIAGIDKQLSGCVAPV